MHASPLAIAQRLLSRDPCPKLASPHTGSHEQPALVDEVWVPTAWHVTRYIEAGVAPSLLRIIPEAVDTDFAPRRSPAPHASAPFTFISVFKWEPRKGWDLLLDAFWREFDGESGVQLVLKTYHGRDTAAA